MVTKKAKVSIYLPEELRDALTRLAADDKRSLSVYMEVLILEALKERGIALPLEDSDDRPE